MDPLLRDGYVRSLHDMATRAEEDGQYRPEEDPYYGQHAVNQDRMDRTRPPVRVVQGISINNRRTSTSVQIPSMGTYRP
jgi:hypothetical protein